MSTVSLKNKMLSGFFWSGLGQFWSLGVSFIISVILARLLSPDEFGTVAVVSVCIAIFTVFVDSGFGSALIQKKELQPEDCSSVFFLNLGMAVILYVVLFCCAPWIADFYHKPILTSCIRVSALTIIIGSLAIVQNTMISRELKMKIFFKISFISQSVSGIIGVVMAFHGFGVWALIAQTLVKSAMTCILLWLWSSWRPVMVVSLARLKGLFQFGWKMLCSSLLDCLYSNIYSILFGKLFDFSTLAFYNRGNHLPCWGMGIINSAINSVLFPSFSSIQNDREQMARVMKKTQAGVFFFVIPAMTLMFLISEPLIVLLFKEKWLPAVPYMRVFCFIYLLYPFHTSNLCLLQACGRSDVFLILEIIKKIQSAVCILLTFRYGPLVMVYGAACNSILGVVENSWMSRKLIDFGIEKQVLNVLPYLAISLFCALVCRFSVSLIGNIWLKTFAVSIVFGIMYLGIAFGVKRIPEAVIEFVFSRLSLLRKKNI